MKSISTHKENLVLAIDCSSTLLIAALDGPGIRRELIVEAGHSHAERLVPSVDDLLRSENLGPRDIDAVVCGKGPGSFTGLRIAMATAKGMAEGLGVPLVSVALMDAIAFSYRNEPRSVMTTVDARKNRFYAAFYQGGSRQHDFHDLSAADLAALAGELVAAGGPSTANAGVLVTGPDAKDFETALGNETTLFEYRYEREGWGLYLASYGREALERGELDGPENAPLYVRVSDGELGITRPK